MAGINLLAPSATNTAVLIADEIQTTGGSSDSIATMTEVGGGPVAAALEIPSTLGGLLLPRLSETQIAALSPVVPGMIAYDLTQAAVTSYNGTSWNVSGAFISVQLTAANVNAMYATPYIILPTSKVGQAYVVRRIAIEAFSCAAAGGGNVYLQYGNTAHGTASDVSDPAAIPAGLITAATHGVVVANSLFGGATGTILPYTTITNNDISITNDTAAFTGAAHGINVYVWYDVLTTIAGI